MRIHMRIICVKDGTNKVSLICPIADNITAARAELDNMHNGAHIVRFNSHANDNSWQSRTLPSGGTLPRMGIMGKRRRVALMAKSDFATLPQVRGVGRYLKVRPSTKIDIGVVQVEKGPDETLTVPVITYDICPSRHTLNNMHDGINAVRFDSHAKPPDRSRGVFGSLASLATDQPLPPPPSSGRRT